MQSDSERRRWVTQRLLLTGDHEDRVDSDSPSDLRKLTNDYATINARVRCETSPAPLPPPHGVGAGRRGEEHLNRDEPFLHDHSLAHVTHNTNLLTHVTRHYEYMFPTHTSHTGEYKARTKQQSQPERTERGFGYNKTPSVCLVLDWCCLCIL